MKKIFKKGIKLEIETWKAKKSADNFLKREISSSIRIVTPQCIEIDSIRWKNLLYELTA